MPLDDAQDPNAWLAALVAASTDAIISCRVDGTIVTWNPAAEATFGYTEQEAVGCPFAIIVPPERLRELSERFARLRAGEVIRDVHTIRMRKDGTRIPVTVNFSPIQAADGTVTGLSATICDLTERSRAEERFRGLLESAPDPIIGVNGEGRMVFANAQAEAVFGYSAAELLGETIELLVPERLRERHVGVRVDYARKPTTRAMGAGLDLRARRRDGTDFPVEISLSPLAEAGGPLTVVIVRDISDRMRIEEDRARERAEIDQMKDDLASMVVHDLKNPVNGIAMTVQGMLRRTGEVSERQRKSLTIIQRTCGEMLRLTQNLLEIAKMEAGRMSVERAAVDLADVVAQVVREYGPAAEEIGKRIVVAGEGHRPIAVGDPGLLKRVLVNLVVNAIRHSGATEVRVELSPVVVEGAVTLRVADDGQGIPAEDRERIFEKFASVRRTPSGEPSADTGLGLPFCKLAIEQMGGSIELTSTPGTRTVFAVTLPLHAPAT